MRERLLTLTFDDGLIRGARRVVETLGPLSVCATFYVVTDWIQPSRRRVREQWNRGRDHGHWRDWRAIADAGHDVGSHTASHLNAVGKKARAIPFLFRFELQRSFDALARELGHAPASVALPYNAWSKRAERSARRLYRAVRLGSSTPTANHLGGIDWYRLHSWSPLPGTTVGDICQRIAALTAGEWLILQWHSLDDEGYQPLAASDLRTIASSSRSMPDLRVMTVSNVIDQYQEAAS